MATRDLQAKVKEVNAFDAQAISTDTTTTGNTVDTLGFESVMLAVQAVSYTDGTYTPIVQESSDDSTYTAVADSDLLPTGSGQEASAALSAAGTFKLGYRGSKRYVRLQIVSSSTSTGATLAGMAVLGDAHDTSDT
jgi:hypothetical protein